MDRITVRWLDGVEEVREKPARAAGTGSPGGAEPAFSASTASIPPRP
ncbi:MAG: hypothetical protein R3F60_06695 [bacterium]